MMNKEEQKVQDAAARWLEKIKKSEEKYQKYYDLITEVREYYMATNKANTYNVFWSSIETLKPFLYFKQPKPYIERSDKNADQVKSLACTMLERALEWDLQQFDFDSAIKYSRNDYLVVGSGIAWEQYKPVFKEVPNPENSSQNVSVKTDETVETIYIDPSEFLADIDKVKIWEDVTWVARKIYLTKQAALDAFGEEIKDLIVGLDEKNDYHDKKITVYEIWDKNEEKIYWLCKEHSNKFLRVSDNVLNLPGFFPCPKPIFATLANSGIIPAPDYTMIKEQLNELNGINSRMKLTMQALKVSGAYDNSFPELADILSKDVTLVSISDFAKMRDAGGIRGIIDFAPIDQYITALETLAARRQDVLNSIYDITGVSDIMRGNSDPNETATAVTKKTNFGALRNQDRQNDMQRFLCDLLKIKASIICELFADDKLMSFLSSEDVSDQEIVLKAIALLRENKLRGMVLDVETDTMFDQDQTADKALGVIKTINDMITTAMPIVSQQPLLLPLYQKMIESVIITLPNARPFEATIESVFKNITEQMAQPPAPEQPDPKVALEQQKLQIEAQNNQEKNAINAEKNQIQRDKNEADFALDKEEMELSATLRAQQIAEGNVNTSVANIPGRIRGFG